MKDGIDINYIRKDFENLGCVSERVNGKYFAMEVPAHCNYAEIKAKLDLLEEQELLGYAEPCLSEQHREQIAP